MREKTDPILVTRAAYWRIDAPWDGFSAQGQGRDDRFDSPPWPFVFSRRRLNDTFLDHPICAAHAAMTPAWISRVERPFPAQTQFNRSALS